jgi:DNA-directed RNA polymerase subunit RPC12/RpoP
MVVKCSHCGFVFGMDPDGKFTNMVWMCNKCGKLNNAERQQRMYQDTRQRREDSKIIY